MLHNVVLAMAAVPSPLKQKNSSYVEFPHTGENILPAGGGGMCSYYYGHDRGAHPLVTHASCTISKADLDSGCETNEETRLYARTLGDSNDDAGHILAHRLGGSGRQPTNIFPQDPHDNRGPWREFEAAVYACVDGGLTAKVRPHQPSPRCLPPG